MSPKTLFWKSRGVIPISSSKSFWRENVKSRLCNRRNPGSNESISGSGVLGKLGASGKNQSEVLALQQCVCHKMWMQCICFKNVFDSEGDCLCLRWFFCNIHQNTFRGDEFMQTCILWWRLGTAATNHPKFNTRNHGLAASQFFLRWEASNELTSRGTCKMTAADFGTWLCKESSCEGFARGLLVIDCQGAFRKVRNRYTEEPLVSASKATTQRCWGRRSSWAGESTK